MRGRNGQLNGNVLAGSAADGNTQEKHWSGAQERRSTGASGEAAGQGGANGEGSTAGRG